TGSGAVTVRVDPTGKAAGVFAGTLLVTAPATGNSPQSVSVVLELAPRYTISASASPADLGTVSGGGSYGAGQTVTLTATPATGAQFVSWTDGANVLSTGASYTFLVSGNRSLVANFRAIQNTVTISTSANPANGGTTSGGGQVAVGATVTLTAAPSTGYVFTNWTESGNVVSTSATYTFVASATRALVANFALQGLLTTVTTSSSPANGGTTTGGGTFPPGTMVT